MSAQWRARKTQAMFDNDVRDSGLKRVLNKWNLTAIGIGCVIGAGIFVMPGLAAKEFAGPSLAISFIIAGLGCAFAALCYAEFASIIPVEGSAYAYSYATMGELFAWIIGWDLIIEYCMSSSVVAVGWSGYFLKFMNLFNVHLPIWMVNDITTCKNLIAEATSKGTLAELGTHFSSLEIPHLFGIDIAINLPAVAVTLVITGILLIGIKEAAGANMGLVILKVAVVIFVIATGAFFVDTANWTPFIPERALNNKGEMSFGYPGIMIGAAYIFYAFIGFDAVSTQAGEAKNPRKDVPFAIIMSLAICTVLYIAVTLVLTGMVKYTDLDITAPIAAAFGQVGLNISVWFISVAALAGLSSVLLVNTLAQSRLFLAMSKDGLLPQKLFGTIHPKFKTPFYGTLLIGSATATIAAVVPIETIAKLVNIGTLFAFTMVCVAVLVLRYKSPELKGSFRVPYLPIVATLGILFNVSLMFSLKWENWVRLIIWLSIGLLVYFLYSQKNSKLRKLNETKNN